MGVLEYCYTIQEGLDFSVCCSKESLKNGKAEKRVLKNSVDLVCLTETNKDRRKVEYENTIWGATSSWRENKRIQVSHNASKAAESEYLAGGTAMIAFDNLVFRISA